jgi:uncharacterized lipoprotein YmbA
MDIARFPIRFRPGDHVCQFYDTAADLAEVLVPYFRDGLERNEACIWITAAPLGAERAASEMRSAVADFDARAARGQILIMGHEELYTQPGAFDQRPISLSGTSRSPSCAAIVQRNVPGQPCWTSWPITGAAL